MPMPTMTPGPPPRPIRGLLPLRSVERYPMSVGQDSSVPPSRPEAVGEAFSAALASGTFVLVLGAERTEQSPAARLLTGRTVYAERNVRRVPTHTGMRLSMAVLVGAGICLGAIDGLLVGGILYTFPWFLIGLAAAGALWWRYGRTYESEVIAATLRATGGGASGAQGSADTVTGTVSWNAGRVRSVLFGGVRTAVGVIDCPIPLMEGLGGMARRFETQLLPENPPQAEPERLVAS